MKLTLWPTVAVVVCLIAAGVVGGCANRGQQTEQSGGVEAPALPVTSGPRAVVENYLKAATSGDGAGMYALIASSERDDESPKTLGDTARDRYSPATTWQILKVEEQGSSAHVIAEFKGAKVDPNPYRFTLSREADEWRIVQSPELHEEERDADIQIKF
jgi:hypothetical protein